MSNKNVHRSVGALAATIKTILKCTQEYQLELMTNPDLKFDFWACILRSAKSYIIGGIGGCLPDKLEPSNILGPNHRQFAHSLTAAAGINYFNFKVKHSGTNKILKECFDDLVTGYNSHLVLDAFTPNALPLLGIKLN